MAAKHTYRYFQKKETSKWKTYNFKQMVNNSMHEQKFDEIKKLEDAFREFYNNAKDFFVNYKSLIRYHCFSTIDAIFKYVQDVEQEVMIRMW